MLESDSDWKDTNPPLGLAMRRSDLTIEVPRMWWWRLMSRLWRRWTVLPLWLIPLLAAMASMAVHEGRILLGLLFLQ